jgi:hypothetical protein
MIIEGQFQVFQRFYSSKLVLKTVESRSTADWRPIMIEQGLDHHDILFRSHDAMYQVIHTKIFAR